MKPKRKPVPKFKSEAQECTFWETHDSSEYVDWSKAERVAYPKVTGLVGLLRNTTITEEHGKHLRDKYKLPSSPRKKSGVGN
mgnify:CR=1 FL=1